MYSVHLEQHDAKLFRTLTIFFRSMRVRLRLGPALVDLLKHQNRRVSEGWW